VNVNVDAVGQCKALWKISSFSEKYEQYRNNLGPFPTLYKIGSR
jgi:hypothetical protein